MTYPIFSVGMGGGMAGTSIELPKYGIFPPLPGFAGDLEQTALYAGESCRLIHAIKPAGHIVRDIAREAEDILQRLYA